MTLATLTLKTRELFTAAMLLCTIACNNASNASRDMTHNASRDSGKAILTDQIPDSITQFLISSCASDFQQQSQTDAIQFRESHNGYLKTSNGKKLFCLCGQFKSTTTDKQDKWIPFATIKTSGYEQYLGPQALAFCNDSTMVWDSGNNDLSLALEAKLAYLKSKR